MCCKLRTYPEYLSLSLHFVKIFVLVGIMSCIASEIRCIFAGLEQCEKYGILFIIAYCFSCIHLAFPHFAHKVTKPILYSNKVSPTSRTLCL